MLRLRWRRPVRERRLCVPALFAAELQRLLPRRHLRPVCPAEPVQLRLQRRDLRVVWNQRDLHPRCLLDVDVFGSELLRLLSQRSMRAVVVAERRSLRPRRKRLQFVSSECDVPERPLHRDRLFSRELSGLL